MQIALFRFSDVDIGKKRAVETIGVSEVGVHDGSELDLVGPRGKLTN